MRRRWARSKRRRTSWITGLNTYDTATGTASRLVTLTTAGFTTANIWGSAIVLVANTDLPAAGGEDSVVTRIIGRLGFMDGRRDTGAGFGAFGFQMRVAVTSGAQIANTNTILADELVTSAGMGKENILFSKDVIVSQTSIGGAGAGFDTTFASGPFWQCDVDIRAKRRVTTDAPILLWFQTVDAGAGLVGKDFRLLGGLRVLMTHPR